MQFPTDTDLAEVVFNSTRVIHGLLEFDWNTNLLFDHEYTDLSDIIDSVDIERSITGDLPEQVSTIDGFASGEMTVVLSGKRRESEMTARDLFSPYLLNSPLQGLDVPGTFVKYSRVYYTDEGPKTVRQFTGWVRDFSISRDDDTVSMTCSDVQDVTSRLVTLPHWAMAASLPGFPIDSGATPSQLTWAVQETLRQCGRPPYPQPRPDALYFASCTGSMLPAVGYGTIADGGITGNVTASGALYIIGEHGVSTNYGISAASWESNFSYGTTNQPFSVTGNGTGLPATTLALAGWFYSDGTLVEDANKMSQVRFYTDVSLTGLPYLPVVLSVHKTGRCIIEVTDSLSRVWRWEIGFNTTLGFHYVEARINFASGLVTATLRIDDTLITLTQTSNPGAFGFTHLATNYISSTTYQNRVYITANVPSQHIMVYGGVTSTLPAYDTQTKRPVTYDGHPLAVIHGRSGTELTHYPDVYHQNGWEVMQELARSEFSVVHTDEFATVHYIPHANLREDWHDQLDDGNQPTYTDEKLLGMILNPTFDGYKNVIYSNYTDRRGSYRHIWQDNDFQLYLGISNTDRWFTIQASELVSVGPGPLIRYSPGAQIPTAVSGCYGVYYDSQGTATMDGVVYVYHDQDQRTFRLRLQTPTLVGHNAVQYSGIDGQGAGIYVSAYTYSDAQNYGAQTSYPIGIAERGVQELRLNDSEWRQTLLSTTEVIQSVLADTIFPAPLVENISIPADARLQLRDVMYLRSEAGVTGALLGQLVGRTISDSPSGGYTDFLNVRVLRAPGEWLLGDVEFSILGQTTIL